MNDNSKDRIAKMMAEVEDDRTSAKNLENVLREFRPDPVSVVVYEETSDMTPELLRLMRERIASASRTIASNAMRQAFSEGTSTIDVGQCGIFGVEMGEKDPHHWACSTLHDPYYQALLDGKDPGKSNAGVQWQFTKGILGNMAQGLYAVISGPFYIVFGALLGGTLRFTQLQYRNDAKRGIKPPSNTPED